MTLLSRTILDDWDDMLTATRRTDTMSDEKLTQKQINALVAISTGLLFPAIEDGRCTRDDVFYLVRGGYVAEGAEGYKVTDKGRAAWKKAIGAK